MNVLLEAIKFNHDPTSETTDALNIRRNETQFVTVPEWQRNISINPEDSPAAYALCETRGKNLTIKAKFKCTDPSIQAIEVRAIDAVINPTLSSGLGLSALALRILRLILRSSLGNVLGEVKERSVTLREGETDFETFELTNVRIWDVGVGVSDIRWRWQFRLSPTDAWTDFETTSHRIYTVLRVPTSPWQQEPYDISNTQLPWVEVLDYACNWAAGAKTADDAATLITRRVNDLGAGVVMYEESQHFVKDFPTTIPGEYISKFDCTSFLNLLHAKEHNDVAQVNCTDCATIVSSFANCVGCDLSQSTMQPVPPPIFVLNPHIKIGIPGWQVGQFFYRHEVAWEGACGINDDIFDACLQVDGDGKPVEEPHTALLPTNIPFSGRDENVYQFLLVLASRDNGCEPHPETRIRRVIGYKSQGNSIINKEHLLNTLKQVYDYEDWANPVETGGLLFVSRFFFGGNEFQNWRLERIRYIENKAWPPFIESSWVNLESNSQVLSVDAYQCPTQKDARRHVLELLTTFQEPSLKRQDQPEIGDIAFATTTDDTILFATSNLVFLVRNVSRIVVPVTDLASRLHGALISVPYVREAKSLVTLQRFRLSTSEALVNDQVPLEEEPPDPLERQRLYKFFSESGRMSLREGYLLYQPTLSGHQTLNIFAVDANGDALWQELRLDVKA